MGLVSNRNVSIMEPNPMSGLLYVKGSQSVLRQCQCEVNEVNTDIKEEVVSYHMI